MRYRITLEVKTPEAFNRVTEMAMNDPELIILQRIVSSHDDSLDQLWEARDAIYRGRASAVDGSGDTP